MNEELNEQQVLLRNTVREFAEREIGPTVDGTGLMLTY